MTSDKTQSDIRNVCMTAERIDTHSHLGDHFPSLRERVAGWKDLSTTQAMIDSRLAAEGCRQLYGIDMGTFARSDSPPAVFKKADAVKACGEWKAIEAALDQAGIVKQLVFCDYFPEKSRPFASQAPAGRLAYLAYIDPAVNGAYECPAPDHPFGDKTYYGRLTTFLGPLASFDAYLDALDAQIDRWRSYGVVGMKTAIAYTSGLQVSDPTINQARAAFAHKHDMTPENFVAVHDYAFRHCLLACRRNHLPVMFHTGFQIWGHASLEQSNPMHLHNLFVDPRYRDNVFVLIHGGNPYTGEANYLAGMFQNVYIDFTWISWMTPARFRDALYEWLANVPNTRMVWGSDSAAPESIMGADRITRGLVADTLEQALKDRVIDERYALEFIENTYLNTPRRLFGVQGR